MTKRSSLKGILAIILIFVIFTIGYVGWQMSADAPLDTNPEEQNTPDVGTSDWKTYQSEEYGFTFRYPAIYEVTEPGSSGPAKSGWKIFRPADDLSGDVLKLNVYLMPSDSEDARKWISSFDMEGNEHIGSIEPFVLGDKQLEKRREFGMDESEQILWHEPGKKFVVLIAISPARSNFIQEAYTIIRSFSFAD